MQNQFTWTQTTAGNYAKWYAQRVADPLNNQSSTPEDYIKFEGSKVYTEDGVLIEPDIKQEVYAVNKEFTIIRLSMVDTDVDGLIQSLGYKLFSTKLKAMDYVTFNKPVITLKDIQEITLFRKNVNLMNELTPICHSRCHTLKSDQK